MTAMNVDEFPESANAPGEPEHLVHFPGGLPGFEKARNFLLVSRPGEEPFCWLKDVDSANLAFLVVSPFHVLPDFNPDIPDGDANFLNIRQPDEALVLTIVTLHRNGEATINLKGPLIFNKKTYMGRQVIPLNASEYSVEHTIPVER